VTTAQDPEIKRATFPFNQKLKKAFFVNIFVIIIINIITINIVSQSSFAEAIRKTQ